MSSVIKKEDVMTKYNIRKIAINRIIYDSKAEARRHQELCLLEKAGKIEALHYHGVSFKLGRSDTGRVVSYTPDFTYIENGRLIAEEVKGPRVRDWAVRAVLFKEKFPEWRLKVLHNKTLLPKLAEALDTQKTC